MFQERFESLFFFPLERERYKDSFTYYHTGCFGKVDEPPLPWVGWMESGVSEDLPVRFWRLI